MLVIVELEQDGGVVKTAECDIAEGATVAEVAQLVGPQLDIAVEEIVMDLGVNGSSFDAHRRVEPSTHAERLRRRQQARARYNEACQRLPERPVWQAARS